MILYGSNEVRSVKDDGLVEDDKAAEELWRLDCKVAYAPTRDESESASKELGEAVARLLASGAIIEKMSLPHAYNVYRRVGE